MKNIHKAILNYMQDHPLSSSREIHDGIKESLGYATLKRHLQALKDLDYVKITGAGRGTKYQISDSFAIIRPIEIDRYFETEIDDREIKESFDLELIPTTLYGVNLFTTEEKDHLQKLQSIYTANIIDLSESQYLKELERLAIDLSWKSSQIEGNTYSLLETERLLKEKETAKGKHKDEATMLLNHKKAIDFIVEHPGYIDPLTIRSIEDIHSLLVQDLDIDRNIRQSRVGITGTNYRPLDNEYQIKEALHHTCRLVNSRASVFDKALLILILLSYIQAFNDGNKRTARIISNACLMKERCCPLSFRTVDSVEYKQAMLIFYEQNNISAFKRIFIEQFEFAVKTYF